MPPSGFSPLQSRRSAPGVTTARVTTPAFRSHGGTAVGVPRFACSREPAALTSIGAGRVPANVSEVLRSPGQPLDAATRHLLERRLGHDFSAVCVHHDTRAAQAARSLVADAFTSGRQIVFGAGKYQPGTDAGLGLLAHELTHVIQQSRASDGSSHSASPVAAEHEAVRAGGEVRQGRSVAANLTGRFGLQRQVRSRKEIEDRLSEVHRELYQNTITTLSEEKRLALLEEYTALEAELEHLPVKQAARELTRAEKRLARVEQTLNTSSSTVERETQLWQERHTLHVENEALKQEHAEELKANTRRERTVRYIRKIPDAKLKAVYFKHLEYYLSDRDRAGWLKTYDWDTFERSVRERFPKALWLDEAQLILLKRSKGGERDRRIAQRHATSVGSPSTPPQAVTMLEEARWWVETEGSTAGQERAFDIIKAVESWLEPITRPANMHRHFGKLPFHDQARVFPGRAHQEVLSLVRRFKIAKKHHSSPSIGGNWDVTINVLRAAEPYLSVLAGQKALRETKIPGIHAAMKRGAAITPLAIASGGLAGGALGWAGVTVVSEGVFLYAGRYLFINAPQLYSSATLYGGAVLTGVGLGQQVIDIRAHGLSVADIPRFISNLMPLFFGMAEQRAGSGGSRSSSGSGSAPAKPVPGGAGVPGAPPPAASTRPTIQASPPPPPARPPAQTLKASPPPPPVPAGATLARGPSSMTDADLVARYAHRPASITAQNPNAHGATWRGLGGTGAAPTAFRGPDGRAWVSTDHVLLAASGRAGIPPVRSGGYQPAPPRQPRADGGPPKPGTKADSPSRDIGMADTGRAPPAAAGPDPLAKTGAAPAPGPAAPKPAAPAPQPGPRTAEASKSSQQSMAPQPRGRSRWQPKDPPQPVSREAVERLKSRASYTTDAENHQRAWKLLGGRGDVAPPAFISEGKIYLDPSRWPPKTK